MISSINKVFIIILVIFSFYANAQSNSKLRWISINDLNVQYGTQPKKILFKVYSKDCHYCQDLEEKVLSNKHISTYINNTFYAVKLDAFDKTSINLRGHMYESKDGFNPLASHLLKGKLKFPTLIFVDEQLGMINYLEGYNNLEMNEMALHYFGDNVYKTTTWQDFQKEFNVRKKR